MTTHALASPKGWKVSKLNGVELRIRRISRTHYEAESRSETLVARTIRMDRYGEWRCSCPARKTCEHTKHVIVDAATYAPAARSTVAFQENDPIVYTHERPVYGLVGLENRGTFRRYIGTELAKVRIHGRSGWCDYLVRVEDIAAA